jgi:Zn-dependent protease
MQPHWRIGSLWGIPLELEPGFVVILLLMALGYGWHWQQLYPNWGSLLPWGAGLAMSLLLIGSVLLHEGGHGWAARLQGIPVRAITLRVMAGGIAGWITLESAATTPLHSLKLAIAGPIVSLLLGVGGCGLATLTHGSAQVLLTSLGYLNLFLGGLNLLPALPMDGGQILQALIWQFTGDRSISLQWTIRTGQILATGAIVAGMILALITSEFSGLGASLLGGYLWQTNQTYQRLTNLQTLLGQLPAKDAARKDYRVLDADMPLRQFADQYLREINPNLLYVATAEGRDRGIVDVNPLSQIERSQWETQSLDSLVQPLSAIPTVNETDGLAIVIQTLDTHHLNQIPVLSVIGSVMGVIDRGDIVQVVSDRLNWAIPPTEIQRIKAEGTYPPDFQFAALAATPTREKNSSASTTQSEPS